MVKRPRTEAQRAASRANGRRSRGPKTIEGKERSRRNALRHGLRATRFEVLAEADNRPASVLIEAVRQRLAPRDVLEVECAEGIAMAFWRLRRVRHLEEAILAGVEIAPGDSELAKAFSLRANGAGAVALLLRYRNQALGELNRWFRLLESRRSGPEIAGPQIAGRADDDATTPASPATDAANDNRAPAPLS
jgi:hypothetical protein